MSLAACRRMKIILARRSKASLSKPAGSEGFVLDAAAAPAKPGTASGGCRAEPITGDNASR